MLDYADHPNVFVCWNSNPTDVEHGTIQKSFDLLGDRISLVHMRDLCVSDYPWLELFRLLRERSFEGFCLTEIPESEQPERIMDYCKALWDAYHRILDLGR
jgi:sugar phosphate isomerase/epimerase